MLVVDCMDCDAAGKEEGPPSDRDGWRSPGLGDGETQRSTSAATTCTVEHSPALAASCHRGRVHQVGMIVVCHNIS